MLFKKMLRDMNEHKMQFIAIFLLSFLTMTIFAGMGADTTGMQQNSEEYYNETNLANIWLYGENFSNDTIDEINNISTTTGTDRQVVLESTGNFDNDPTVTLHFTENNTISQYYPVDGSNIDLDDEDGIWLDKRFAETKNLSIGDNISVTFNGITMEKTIRGLGYSPEYVYESTGDSIVSDFNLQGFAYLSYKAFPLNDVPYNTVLITTDDDADSYHEKIDEAIGDIYTSIIPREDFESYAQFNDEVDQHAMFAYIFPVIFVVVAILTLITTMTRIVNNQRTQIGTLKALGCTNRSLIIHYTSYGLYLTAIGAILGLIVGPPLLEQLLLPSMSAFYTLPKWDYGFDISFIIVALLLVIISTFSSYLVTKNIVRESPAASLEPKAPKISRNSILEKIKVWNKLSFNTRWNIRDINRSKLRSLVTVLGVVGCTVLLIGGFGMYEDMHNFSDWQFGGINHYNTQLVLEENATDSQIASILSEVNGTQVMNQPIEIRANGVKKTQSITVYNQTDLITPTDQYTNPITLPEDGVSLTIKSAQLLGVEEGDTIEWHMYGNTTWINSTVDKIYADPTTQGITISPEKLEEYGINYTTTSIITSQEVNSNLTGVSTVNSVDDLMNSWDTVMESGNLLVGVLLFFAIVLSIVILYSLSILGFTEVERDLATLKVIGFKNKDIRKLFLTQNLWLSIIGFIIGVPLGFEVIRIMWDSSGDNFYYPIQYSLTTILFSFILTIVLSLLVNILLTRKINVIDMVEALKKGRE
ncbi:ABC transporter permease [Methanosphaera sp.]